MDESTSDVLDRLRTGRSLAWLRMIDRANLDSAAEDEPDAETVVRPYQWLLRHVGDGVTLTQAGYLPPATVTAAMTELGWDRDWIGKNNREDVTLPVLDLRESAQRFGLLRKSRGQLLPTKIGQALTDDPLRLWWQLADRLPDNRSDPERQAGVLYLIMVAAGSHENDRLLADGMTILGWAQGDPPRPLTPDAAVGAARETWALFDRLALVPRQFGRGRTEATEHARRLARAALLGRNAATRGRAKPREPEPGVQLRVSLRDTNVWRTVVVPASVTMHELHDVLQTAMGWRGGHLHLFDVAGVLYGDVEDFPGTLGDEDVFTLGQAVAVAPRFRYEYDFGDGWEHDVSVEQPMSDVSAPCIVDGGGACPPEDCGGPAGFAHLLDVLADRSHAEHAQLSTWLGGPYEPDRFDPVETNARLELVDRHTRRR